MALDVKRELDWVRDKIKEQRELPNPNNKILSSLTRYHDYLWEKIEEAVHERQDAKAYK